MLKRLSIIALLTTASLWCQTESTLKLSRFETTFLNRLKKDIPNALKNYRIVLHCQKEAQIPRGAQEILELVNPHKGSKTLSGGPDEYCILYMQSTENGPEIVRLLKTLIRDSIKIMQPSLKLQLTAPLEHEPVNWLVKLKNPELGGDFYVVRFLAKVVSTNFKPQRSGYQGQR